MRKTEQFGKVAKAAKVVGGIGIGAGVAAGLARWEADRIEAHQVDDLETLLSPPKGVTHHRIEATDGSELHVVEAGSGRPLLFLHGVTLQWWVWNTMFHLLSKDFRVIAWDMRGHGESTVGPDGMDLAAVAGDIGVVIDELELDSPVIIGHSMGGMALMEYCASQGEALPSIVDGLVLVATSGDVLPDVVDSITSRLAGLVVGGLSPSRSGPSISGLGLMRHHHLGTLVTRLAFGTSPSGTAVEHVRQMGASMVRSVTVAAIDAISRHNTNAKLNNVMVPTAVVVGSRDLLTPPYHARQLMGSFSNATLHQLPGIGHQVMQEDPVALAAIIRSVAAGSRGLSHIGAPRRSGRMRKRR